MSIMAINTVDVQAKFADVLSTFRTRNPIMIVIIIVRIERINIEMKGILAEVIFIINRLIILFLFLG
jgi:hypothetical protein